MHDRDRISSWREQKQENDDDHNNAQKTFLTPPQKRKIAFIQQEFHPNADTVNAYIVFAHPPDTEIRPSNLPPLPPIMDPYEAAQLAVSKCDGTLFMGRMIRVDYVVNHKSSGDKHSGGDGDPKLSIFVGNLDFTSTEEDLRVFFEGVISAERGPPIGNDGDDGDGDDRREMRGNTWVTRVRIVRDKDTQLGKGFAYVQFSASKFIQYTRSIFMMTFIGS
jgi:nucleolar protein 12